MVKVKYTSNAERGNEEIVIANTKVRDFLMGKNAMMNAHFTANGTSITDKLDMTFQELIDTGVVASGVTITLYETIKTSNAAC